MTAANETPKLTIALAEFTAGLRFEDLPPAAVDIVAAAFADTVGVMAAGTQEAVVRVLMQASGALANRGARSCLTSHRLDSPEAALIGGTAAHALDYDDVSMSAHPSAVLVPAILAEADMIGASGRQMVTAYVAGFEVWADLFSRNKDYHRKGWHPTALFGPIAVAAAAASLHGLDARTTTNALAIAASQAGGLVSNFGSMTKPFHAGLAARNGISSVQLAKMGMTGSPDALEHPQGYLSAIAPYNPPDIATPTMVGREWSLLRRGLNVKRYPTCYATHRSIDAMLDLVARHDLKPADIASVEVRMGVGQASALRNSRPTSGLEAKFSEEFAMACAVVKRRIGLAELTDEVVAEPEIRALFPKVTTVTVDESDPEDPVFSSTEDLTVRLVDGRVLEAHGIRHPKGHARNPMGPDELFAKFEDCVTVAGAGDRARALYQSLTGLASTPSASAIPTMPWTLAAGTA